MQSRNPLVSVLVATYNSEKFIRETLDSLQKQSYKNLEILVCDDASSDGTVDIVKSFQEKDKRILLIQNQRNLGISLNMNNGIQKAQGKYVAILDADDWSYPYRIEDQVKVMEGDKEIILCSGYMHICDENLKVKNLREYPLHDKEIRKALVRYNPISHPASMWRTSELMKTSLYNNRFPIARDYDLVVRISEFGKYQNIPKPLIKYRVRKDSETGKRVRQTQWYSFYIQMKAHFEYDFPLKFSDLVFLTSRMISTVILPIGLQRIIANNFSKIKK
ncbi:MAG: glycosyltransferase [Candidatus Dojkabacteria bacterium]|nr:glycosyltransferase [Candidatus Dojkabacteria bacterium]